MIKHTLTTIKTEEVELRIGETKTDRDLKEMYDNVKEFVEHRGGRVTLECPTNEPLLELDFVDEPDNCHIIFNSVKIYDASQVLTCLQHDIIELLF